MAGLVYKYVTDRPRFYWKVQRDANNRKELFDLIKSWSKSVTEVDGVIEWSYGMMPTVTHRLAEGDWLYSNQFGPVQNVSQLGTSTTEPLTQVRYQDVPSEYLKYVVEEGE